MLVLHWFKDLWRALSRCALIAVLAGAGWFGCSDKAISQVQGEAVLPEQVIKLRRVVVEGRLATPQEIKDVLLVRSGGQAVPAELGLVLKEGDIIATATQKVVVTWAVPVEGVAGENAMDMAVELTIAPWSQVDLPSTRLVYIREGRLFLKAKPPLLKDLFQIKTRYGVAGVEGTQFWVQAGDEKATVSVLEGIVQVQSGDSRQAYLLQPGEGAVLGPGDRLDILPLEVKRLKEIVDWVRGVEAVIKEVEGDNTGSYTGQLVPDLEAIREASEVRRWQVREAQELLNALNYDAGPADGIITKRTLAAVRRFRDDAGLPGGTQIDEALLKALRRALEEGSKPPLFQPKDVDLGPAMLVPEEGKTYTRGTLTVEGLKRCMGIAQRMVEQRRRLEEIEARLTPRREEIEAFKRRLDQEYQRLGRTDQAAIDRYNSLVEKHRRLAQDFNTRLLPQYDTEVDAYKRRGNNWDTRCSGNRFYLDDLKNARAALENQGRLAAQRARVAEAQTLLKGLGYYPGGITGMEEEKTWRAVRRFREAQDLPAGAEIDAALLRVLNDAFQKRLKEYDK